MITTIVVLSVSLIALGWYSYSKIIYYKDQIQFLGKEVIQPLKQQYSQLELKFSDLGFHIDELGRVKEELINARIKAREAENLKLIDELKCLKADFDMKVQSATMEYERSHQQLETASKTYLKTLEETYRDAEEEYDEKINMLHMRYMVEENHFNEMKNNVAAGLQAKLREQEKKDKINFYKLSEPQDSDFNKLLELRKIFKEVNLLNKLIWTAFFQKQTTELCNRVVGTTTKIGIYKLTNLKTEQCYIGQSVNIADRFKQHCKCGLGIDTPAANKLYKSMYQDGVWNFTFEILEECSRDKLNDRERFWIDFYQSDKFGLNSNKGVGK